MLFFVCVPRKNDEQKEKLKNSLESCNERAGIALIG
jgi:hypothetical protein